MSRIVQIAMAGNPTTGSSLRAGMVSSVMQRARWTIRDEYLIVDGGKLAGVGAHSYTAGDATGGSTRRQNSKASTDNLRDSPTFAESLRALGLAAG